MKEFISRPDFRKFGTLAKHTRDVVDFLHYMYSRNLNYEGDTMEDKVGLSSKGPWVTTKNFNEYIEHRFPMKEVHSAASEMYSPMKDAIAALKAFAAFEAVRHNLGSARGLKTPQFVQLQKVSRQHIKTKRYQS